MSCVLVVRQDMIDQRPEAVQILVDGIARSGLWLEKASCIVRMRLILWDASIITRILHCCVEPSPIR